MKNAAMCSQAGRAKDSDTNVVLKTKKTKAGLAFVFDFQPLN
jgi:hypothetical protein